MKLSVRGAEDIHIYAPTAMVDGALSRVESSRTVGLRTFQRERRLSSVWISTSNEETRHDGERAAGF